MQTIHIIPNQEKRHKNDKTSEQLSKQVEEFLANGGKINKIQTGVSGQGKQNKGYANTPSGTRKCENFYYPSLTVSEFAKDIGKTEWVVRSYIRRGLLTSTKRNGNTPQLIRLEEQQRFKQWLRENE